ncbi:hypothetical protein D9M70_483730 [compost metagenome]
MRIPIVAKIGFVLRRLADILLRLERGRVDVEQGRLQFGHALLQRELALAERQPLFGQALDLLAVFRRELHLAVLRFRLLCQRLDFAFQQCLQVGERLQLQLLPPVARAHQGRLVCKKFVDAGYALEVFRQFDALLVGNLGLKPGAPDQQPVAFGRLHARIAVSVDIVAGETLPAFGATQSAAEAYRFQHRQIGCEGIFARLFDFARKIKRPVLCKFDGGGRAIAQTEQGLHLLADRFSDLGGRLAGSRQIADERQRQRAGRPDGIFASDNRPIAHSAFGGLPLGDANLELVHGAKLIFLGAGVSGAEDHRGNQDRVVKETRHLAGNPGLP